MPLQAWAAWNKTRDAKACQVVSISHRVDRSLQMKDQPAVPIQKSNQDTFAVPLLAYCLCQSHPAVRASCCSCYSPLWLPAPELLENYLAKWHEDKRENPRTFPITDEKEYSIAMFSAKEIKLTGITSFAYQFLIALMPDEKRKLLNTAKSELKKYEVCTKCVHYYATLYWLCCFPTSSLIPSGNLVFKISQGFGKAAEVKVGNGTHASGNPAWA